jgi:ribosomal protein L30
MRRLRSGIAHPRGQKATVRALGLRRLHQSVVRPDTPQLRGMVFKVRLWGAVYSVAMTCRYVPGLGR